MSSPGDPLARALAEALGGKRRPLFDLLMRGSRLPGTRMNVELAEAFAVSCRSLRGRADELALAMAHLSADEAPGATAGEFLPVCGLHALAARAAADPAMRARALAELHARADDLRFRVRESVIDALARIGGAAGDALVLEVQPWMDGYFHAAAVLLALGKPTWLPALHDVEPVLARLDEAFVLVRDSQRAAARWPGHKALIEALAAAPAPLATRFGVPVFDLLVRWAGASDPALRDVVERVLEVKGLVGRFAPELERVRGALIASRPAPRNPDHDHGPSRDRSKHRKRDRR